MKKINLSIVTAICALSINANATSLQESLTNGKVNGAIIGVYSSASATYSVDTKSPAQNSNNASIAAQLNYKSADFYGFKLGLGFQAGHDLNLQNGASGATSEDDYRNTISAASLYNIYLEYATPSTTIKAGKQTIVSPLLMNSGAWALRDSFNAISVVNKSIPDTTVSLYYVKDWYKRYDGDATITAPVYSEKSAHYEKPIYSIFVTNNSVKGLRLDAQYLTTNQTGSAGDTPTWTTDSYSTYYTRAMYKLPISHPLTIGAMTAGTKYDSSDDSNIYGVKIATKLSVVELDVAYTKNSDKADYTGTLGHVPNFWSFNNLNFNDDMFAGLQTISAKIGYNFGIDGLKSSFSYAKFSQSTEGQTVSGKNFDGASEYGFDIKYAFSGSFKGLSSRLQLVQVNQDIAGEDKFNYAKLYLKYAF